MSATNVARVEKRVSIRQYCTMERSDQCLLVLSRLPHKLWAKKTVHDVFFLEVSFSAELLRQVTHPSGTVSCGVR